MKASLLLVHSPLVGPSTWAAFAELASAAGIATAVPDLTRIGETEPPRWRVLTEGAAIAAQELTEPVAVLGHSGAGVFLPAIADRLGHRFGAVVFVDAVIPPRSGVHETPLPMREMLDGKTVDGRLEPWLDWWPTDVVEDLLPDPEDRRLLRADMPRLPRSFYDEAVPVPVRWSRWPCAYLKLSSAYDQELDEARTRGWPHAAIDSSHLGIYTDAERVLAVAQRLLHQLNA